MFILAAASYLRFVDVCGFVPHVSHNVLLLINLNTYGNVLSLCGTHTVPYQMCQNSA